jgi:hypothetical protein
MLKRRRLAVHVEEQVGHEDEIRVGAQRGRREGVKASPPEATALTLEDQPVLSIGPS